MTMKIFVWNAGSHTLKFSMEFRGPELDQNANATCRPDADLAAAASTARILRIGTREDLKILRDARRGLPSSPTNRPREGEHARLSQ